MTSSKDFLIETYGFDPNEIDFSSYSIIKNTNMLVITSPSKLTFTDIAPDVEEVYGEFSNSYYYYFKPLNS